MAAQLQGHAHWITEFAIKVVSAALGGKTATVSTTCYSEMVLHNSSFPGVKNKEAPVTTLIYIYKLTAPVFTPQVPDTRTLVLLRQSLLLVYMWNKALPQPILLVTG